MSSRCVYCYGFVNKDETRCSVCGSAVPKGAQLLQKPRTFSALTNLVFFASLTFTAYCYFFSDKLPLPAALTIFSALLLIRILAEEFAKED
jgi:hypothetical protein